MRKRDVDREIEELGCLVRRLRGEGGEEGYTARKCAAGCQSCHRPISSSLVGKQRSTSRKRKEKKSGTQSVKDLKGDRLGSEEKVGMESTWKSTQTTQDRATSPKTWTEDDKVGKSLNQMLLSSAQSDRVQIKTEAPKVGYSETKIEAGLPVDYYAISIQKYAAQKWENIIFESETSRVHRAGISTRESNQSLNLDAKASITDLSSELRSLHQEMQLLTADRSHTPQKRENCESCKFLVSKGFSTRHCRAHGG